MGKKVRLRGWYHNMTATSYAHNGYNGLIQGGGRLKNNDNRAKN